MKNALLVAFTLTLAGCKVSIPAHDPTKTGAEAIAVFESCFQANLPPNHENPRVHAVSVMTLIVEGRVEMSEEDFRLFLEESALVPDKLEPGNLLTKRSGIAGDWWTPSKLANPVSISCEWKDGGNVATCDLAFGRLPDEELPTMFFEIVYENENATGADPEVHADPNWRPNPTKLQQGEEADAE